MAEEEITGLLDDLEDLAEASGETVTVGDLVDRLGARGFGPLLAVCAAFLITPVGMIPGMPAIVAIILAAIAVQMVRGERGLWLPNKVRGISFAATRLTGIARWARPFATRLRPVLTRRLSAVIDNPVAPRAVAALLLIMTVVLIVVGFIPGLPFVIGLNLLLIGLAMTAVDGVVFVFGLATMIPAIWLIWHFAL